MKDGPEGWEEVVREDMFLLCRRIFSLRIAVLLGGEGGGCICVHFGDVISSLFPPPPFIALVYLFLRDVAIYFVVFGINYYFLRDNSAFLTPLVILN